MLLFSLPQDIVCPDVKAVAMRRKKRKRDRGRKRRAAKVMVVSRGIGGLMTFSCPPGHMLQGAKQAVCQVNGRWSAPPPICKGTVHHLINFI